MKTLPSVLAIALLAAAAQTLAQTDIQSILADSTRPQEDRDRDASRKPDLTLDFFGIGSGDHVADLFTGSGYWTRILVPLVGPSGKVYSGNNPFFGEYYDEALDALLSEPAFANVVRVDGRADALSLPADGSLDAVLIVLAYHDLFLTDEDRAAMNRAIFAALKPGGVLGIVDHEAGAGVGASVVESRHRIEKNVVVEEVRAAGFELAAEADFLRNPADDHAASVFDPSVQGKTDRFVLRFEKPRA
jgi:predicted methyltransferase